MKRAILILLFLAAFSAAGFCMDLGKLAIYLPSDDCIVNIDGVDIGLLGESITVTTQTGWHDITIKLSDRTMISREHVRVFTDKTTSVRPDVPDDARQKIRPERLEKYLNEKQYAEDNDIDYYDGEGGISIAMDNMDKIEMIHLIYMARPSEYDYSPMYELAYYHDWKIADRFYWDLNIGISSPIMNNKWVPSVTCVAFRAGIKAKINKYILVGYRPELSAIQFAVSSSSTVNSQAMLGYQLFVEIKPCNIELGYTGRAFNEVTIDDKAYRLTKVIDASMYYFKYKFAF